MIKEMANFVEPYLPPGFRTRLQGRGEAGAIPSMPSMPDAPSTPSMPSVPSPAETPDTKPPQ